MIVTNGTLSSVFTYRDQFPAKPQTLKEEQQKKTRKVEATSSSAEYNGYGPQQQKAEKGQLISTKA